MLLVIVLFNVDVLCDTILSPVVFGLSFAIHVNEDATLLVRGIFTMPPLQIVAVAALVIVGVGLTVTVTVCVTPTQPPVVAVGVTVYVTALHFAL